jgi:hypothetical protein
MQHLFYALIIEITQHVGIASTTGFYIASGVDMQASPRGSAKYLIHALLIGVFASEARFGKPQSEPWFSARLYVFFALETGYIRACFRYVAAG